ncbi:MAG: hypothetical protein ACYC5K_09755 [Saccharofermentanales bacterium]
MDIITEWKVEKGRSNLITSGLPVAAGRLSPSDFIEAISCPDGRPCPLWWESRSIWPDGSVRWLFLHVVATSETASIRLQKQEDGSRADFLPPFPTPEHGIQPLPDGFMAQFGTGVTITVRSEADCSLPASKEQFRVDRIEDSPIAPLYRISNRKDGCIDADFVVRLDLSCSSVDVICRHTLRKAGIVQMRRIGIHADVDVSGKGGPSQENCEKGEDARIEDIEIRSPYAAAVLLNGRRRGPVRAARSERSADSFDFEIFGGADVPYELTGGTSYRNRIRLSACADRSPSKMLPPAGYVASTGVFGPVADLTADASVQAAPGMVKGLKLLFEKGRIKSGTENCPEDGILHDGDWLLNPGQYGAKGYIAYADNEYDTPFAYYLAHAACADDEYLDIALRGSVHMADMDCLCTTGDMLYHGYNEEAENHRTNRVGKGDPGHYWTDGLWSAYFWAGDLFAREAACQLTEFVIERFRNTSFADEFSICERNIGWPMLVAVSALETGLADASASSFCEDAIDFLDRYTADPDLYYMDPAGPVWWRCAFRDGSKPFMLGILGEAAERYLILTGNPKARLILDRISDFIMTLHDPVRMDFDYEFNAFGPQTRHISAQQLIPLFVRTLLSGSQEGGRNGWSAAAAASFHACTWYLFDLDTGKDIALMTRGLLPSLAILIEAEKKAQNIRSLSHQPSAGQAGKVRRSSLPGEPEEEVAGIYTDCGNITIRYRPDRDPEEYLNRQAFFHLCDGLPNRSAVSAIAFYNRVQIRFYDEDGNLIDSLDYLPDESFFQAGSVNEMIIRYEAPGTATLEVNGIPVCSVLLDRPLSGSFRKMYTGTRPGNWKANGLVEVEADFDKNPQ